jgi:hypothetical protein
MLDFERTLEQLSGLIILKFFPADPGARLELAKLVARMCANQDQVEWLVGRTTSLCNEWPGPVVLRQILCSKFKPADGYEAGATDAFPSGPSSESGDMRCLAERALGTPERLALPPGHIATVDPGFDRAIRMVANELDMNRPRRRIARAEEVPTNPNFKPITQADVDREVQALRDKRARAELLPPEAE